MDSYDLVVIGAGPGGYVAAIRAAQLGKKVALIEKEHLGGVCLNWGCIPTKALLRSAELIHNIKNAKEFGINIEGYSIDIQQMVARSRNIAKQLSGGIRTLLMKNKVTIIEGVASILQDKIVLVNKVDSNIKILSKDIIIATGARPRIIKGFEPDGQQIWTAKEAMTPTSLPKSIAIVGAGAIGVEFASFYATLGVEVILIEARYRILSAEDEETASLAKKIFEQQGWKIFTAAKLLSCKKEQEQVVVNIEIDGKERIVTTEKLLMAVGVIGNTENIGLENTKVRVDNGRIVTNELMQTDEDGIYAIGDVTDGPWLAHKASHEAIIAAEVIATSKSHHIEKNNIPACTYSIPQIASVGLTEAAARSAGHDILVGKIPFAANGKALVIGESAGFIKTIFDKKTGELLGAHMIGSEVTELIQGYTIAKNLEITEVELMNTVFPHPTLSEMMHESVLQAYKKAIHI